MSRGVSVVIPAFNEEAAISTTIDRVRAAIAGLAAAEILVIDDGSTDRTAALAGASGARVVRHAANAGYGQSVKDGVVAAAYDTIVIADGDGTYPADHIPALLERFDQGFDMVVGARSGSNYREAGPKRILRRILTFLVEFTVGQHVPDVNSGLRVFSRPTVVNYFGQLCNTFSFTTSLTLAYMMTGRFVAYVPIGYDARVGVTKVRLFRDAMRTLQYMVQSIVYYNPIKMFLLLASVCLFVAAAGGVAGLAGWPAGWLLGGISILTAVAISGLGLLADLLRQIMAK